MSTPRSVSIARAVSFAGVVAALLIPPSCAPSEESEPEPCPQGSTDIRRYILIPRCGDCHGTEDPAAGLNLVQADIERRVIDVDSEDCDWKIVVAGKPDESLLIRKLYADPPCGEIMPRLGAALSERELSCLRLWVEDLERPVDDAGSTADADVDAEPNADAAADAATDAAAPACPTGQMRCGSKCINAIEPRFGSLYSRIFVTSCTFNACHSGDPPKEGLDLLDADGFHAATLNVPSLQRPELMRIKPGHPEESYLVNKLRGVDMAALDSTGVQESVRMPPEQPLCDEKIALIEQWILAGAPKD